MDIILFKNIELFGCHGVNPSEKITPQRFIFNIKIHLNLIKPCKTDELEDTVNYSEVLSLVKEIFDSRSFNLLECMAESVSQAILSKFNRISYIELELCKPDIPMLIEVESVGVLIKRSRD